ncbi:unnamed protein product [Paramecium sonneborni]|uniref:Uncharacterized protein n=1 Tax=Paramecium sonneborni TaxID=65129 RepID=A0A8S1LXQ6_9CILI|nr:unnamed protein product [Paramecium sonneborni]
MTNLRMHKHYLMFSVVQCIQQLTQNKILYIIKSKGEHGNRSRNNIDISNDDRYLYQNNCRKRILFQRLLEYH